MALSKLLLGVLAELVLQMLNSGKLHSANKNLDWRCPEKRLARRRIFLFRLPDMNIAGPLLRTCASALAVPGKRLARQEGR